MEIMESAEQNIITVQPEEIAFFEEFTKKYAISWTRGITSFSYCVT